MLFEKRLKFFLQILFFCCSVIFLIIVFFPVRNLSVNKVLGLTQRTLEVKKAQIPVKTVNPLTPVRLSIPKIEVDAVIEAVGIKADGAMDVSNSSNRVSWFSLGSRPGELGTAVIAGHYGWKDSLPATFDNLSELQAGDLISVENGSGAQVFFVVIKSKLYNEGDDATDVFNSTDKKSHLNLITCDGVWDEIKKSYSNRLVVFTDRL